ncbi:MAG: beta-ketoacyl synthase N-terminal-like domain-containing protein [Acidobacteriota bacterium]
MSDRVRLVSAGACTSVGGSLQASAAAVRAGLSAFAHHAFMVDTAGKPMIVACASFVPPAFVGFDRLRQLSTLAAEEALSSSGLSAGSRVPAFIGVPPTQPGLPDDLRDSFRARFSEGLSTGVSVDSVELVASGHSAGLMALARGCQAIREGSAEAVLIGGVDSHLDPSKLEKLESTGQLHGAGSYNNAWGFVPGEGAGFCVLVSERGRPVAMPLRTVEISAVGLAEEACLINTDSVCLGHGLTGAFEQVLGGPEHDLIESVLCDMNGEPYRAEEYAFATIRTQAGFVDASSFETPADCWGDVGAASGPLLLGLVWMGVGKGYRRSRTTLVWTSSESGERAAAVVSVRDGDER